MVKEPLEKLSQDIKLNTYLQKWQPIDTLSDRNFE